ncbi:MAG: hypothetical protein HY804_09300 [Nitrospinae bacterium]|nr:hypothetical protein [Nitrospinota bacterium]
MKVHFRKAARLAAAASLLALLQLGWQAVEFSHHHNDPNEVDGCSLCLVITHGQAAFAANDNASAPPETLLPPQAGDYHGAALPSIYKATRPRAPPLILS